MMANRRLCLSQEGIGHGLPEIPIVHGSNPRQSNGVRAAKPVDELRRGIEIDLGRS